MEYLVLQNTLVHLVMIYMEKLTLNALLTGTGTIVPHFAVRPFMIFLRLYGAMHFNPTQTLMLLVVKFNLTIQLMSNNSIWELTSEI